MKFLLTILLGLILCSCSSIKYDYKPDIDFSKYESFSFVTSKKSKSLNRQRLEKSLIEGLSNKGLKFIADASASKPADLVIKPRYQIVNNERIVTTQGGLYNNRFYSGTDFYFVESKERYLVIDMVDTRKNEVVWQATSYGFNAITFSQEKFDKIIAKMMELYPPDQIKKN
jgi:hypothetical protein